MRNAEEENCRRLVQCGNENANFYPPFKNMKKFSYYALKMSSYIHYHFDAHEKE
jgi:hypothetical protein